MGPTVTRGSGPAPGADPALIENCGFREAIVH